jgi:Mg2+ and Co2+ transporter CorA
MATENHIPFPGGYDDLSRLASLENRFLQMQVLLKQSLELMDSLIADPDTNGLPAAVNGLKAVSSQVLPAPEWHKARCAAYLFAADYLHKRTQSAIQLLTLGISLQDQAIAKDQNAAMLGLNRSVGFITTITLFYLPASFVSTFFGMSFFGLEETSGRLISSHMIWIYVLSAAILTACTLALYSRQGDWFYGWVRGKTSGSSIEMKSLGSRFRAAMV